MLSGISYQKVALKIVHSFQNIVGILLKMYYEMKLFQDYPLQSVLVVCIKKWGHTQKLKISKICFNTFYPVGSFLLISKFTIFLLISFPYTFYE